MEHSLIAYRGNDIEKPLEISARVSSDEAVTQSETAPLPSSTVIPTSELNVTWLLNHLDDDLKAKFKIDKKKTDCMTPRRNGDVEKALEFFKAAIGFANTVEGFLASEVLSRAHVTLCSRGGGAINATEVCILFNLRSLFPSFLPLPLSFPPLLLSLCLFQLYSIAPWHPLPLLFHSQFSLSLFFRWQLFCRFPWLIMSLVVVNSPPSFYDRSSFPCFRSWRRRHRRRRSIRNRRDRLVPPLTRPRKAVSPANRS